MTIAVQTTTAPRIPTPPKKQRERPGRWRFSRDQYYYMVDAGWLNQQRAELIEGEVILMPAMKNFHAICIELIRRELEKAFGQGHWVRVQLPLHLRRRSSPEPDLAVVAGDVRSFTSVGNVHVHPTTARLVVEVSDTTLRFDQGRKASLYAASGIADYWIFDLTTNRLEIRRQPVRTQRGRYRWAYRDLTILADGDFATPLDAPHARIAVADLIP